MSLGNPLQSLESEQLQAVAEWLREVALDYDEAGEKPAEVGRCLRSQAAQLEILATELHAVGSMQVQPIQERPSCLHSPKEAVATASVVVRGWILYREGQRELSYQLMGDGQTYRQIFKGELETDPEPCPSQEMEQAYRSGKFAILAGAEHLADYFTA